MCARLHDLLSSTDGFDKFDRRRGQRRCRFQQPHGALRLGVSLGDCRVCVDATSQIVGLVVGQEVVGQLQKLLGKFVVR